jgi:hypothetical protein
MAKVKHYDDGGSILDKMRSDMGKAYKDTDVAYKNMESMDKAKNPAPTTTKKMVVPQDIDGASAGRKFKKDEPGLPEQPGSGIIVKPIKKAAGGTASARADGIAQRGKTRGTMC